MKYNNCNSNRIILHLIDTTGPGGAETVFIQLADKLRDMGNQSIVVIRGNGWVKNELERRGLTPIVIPSKGSFALGFLKELISIIKMYRVDVIQSHLLGSNVYGAIAGLITRTPVVATYHGMVDINPNERFKWLKNRVMKWGITRYVAVSQQLLNNIRNQNLLVQSRASVIYNGVDISRYGMNSSDSIKTKLNLNDNSILAGCLGNIRPAKAYHILIDAGAELIKKYPELHFVIAGDKKKSLMEQLDKQLKQRGVERNFHFIGFSDNSAEFLTQMNLFVLCSSSEGFSISTIEAMASGLPVVVTKCGGPEEIVTPDENGIMVETNNPRALSKGISLLIDDSDLCQKISVKGKKHVALKFSLEKMLNNYNALYNDL